MSPKYELTRGNGCSPRLVFVSVVNPPGNKLQLSNKLDSSYTNKKRTTKVASHPVTKKNHPVQRPACVSSTFLSFHVACKRLTAQGKTTRSIKNVGKKVLNQVYFVSTRAACPCTLTVSNVLDVLNPKNMTKKNSAKDRLHSQHSNTRYAVDRVPLTARQHDVHIPIPAKPNNGSMDAGNPMFFSFSGTRSPCGRKAERQKHTSTTAINGHV